MFTITAGVVVHPRGLADVFGVVLHGRDVRQLDRRAVAVRDDQRLIIGARQQLIVRADLKRLVRAVEVSLCLIHIGRRDRAAQSSRFRP